MNNINKLGLGFMRWNTSLPEIKKVVDYGYKNGINYFEACTFYLNNNCENTVKYCLQDKPRNTYYICDKISVLGTNLNNLNLEEFFNNQLHKCGVDYFDIYLLQALDRRCIEILNKYPIYQFFLQKKKEGKIKQLGFSFHDTVEYLEYYLKTYQWDIVQIQLNYFDWYLSEAKKLYFKIKEYNLPIIVMGGLKGGTLTEKLPNNIKQQYSLYELTTLAYNFLNTLENVKIILSGATSIEYLQNNLNIINNFKGFTKSQKELCLNILNEYKKYNLITCTECKYCEPFCSQHIPISQIFKLYNQILSNNDNIDKQNYFNISKTDQSQLDCVGCGQCEKHCPQHLPIKDYMFNQIFTYRL